MPSPGAGLDGLPRGLALEWPGGGAGDPASAVRLRLKHRSQLARIAQGRIGDLAEDYVRGELDIEGAPADVMAVAGVLVGDPLQAGRRPPLPRWLSHLRSRWRHHLARDASQVQFHYDTSDSFFALWLDPLRVYSCAYFADPGMTLAQAQQAKLDLVCRKLQLSRGQRLLDIGAGWGGLLTWAAAHYGVRAVGITLSRNQHAHVGRLVDDMGLRGQVEMRLLDYRALADDAGFDRIASVGMFEHVGRAQLAGYFSRLHSLLRPGGLLLNHGIAAGGTDNVEIGAGMGRFIERHIFPGGELVHVSDASRALARGGLELLDAENLRPHYARTLWAWSDALEAHLARARALTSEATVRAYRLYLAGSAMCFERGWLSLYQLLAARPDGHPAPRTAWPGRSDYPFTRRHMAP
ncbi:class I SAM-dependent methyltransferase [Rubrivivax sp. RP6-9]|uniref:class I SAM-dependent methyltransferase n=1 Tax=Rubrivivax sp. RP6-9 TaxID=3415750 RepID=UPI003CC6B49D